MKTYILTIILFLTFNSFSQDIFFGIQISPAFKLQSIRNKASGLITSVSGYGFGVGVPVKFSLDNEAFFTTGLNYDFTAFDQKANNFLISSIRLNSINIPMVYNYPILSNLMLNAGGGLKYILKSKQLSTGSWINLNPLTNQIQPYLNLGASILQNNFEIGINTKYHLINLWSNSLNASSTRTKLIDIALNFNYFF